MKRLNKTLSSALIGLFLVGCSLLSVQRSPADQAFERPRAATPVPDALRPGLTPVVVEQIGRSGATIAWRSSWEGRSHVIYGSSPRLVPTEATHSPVTAQRRVALTKLKPNTRYYFQVETQTALGVARSAVLSFRTR
ncbi:MAG: fibronectin type III domain-containing protein [Candidatus Sericytochromatia bacterium]